jgi:hypothetical protein
MTITQERAEGGRQLLRLKRLTVGSDDQLDGSLSSDGAWLYYTARKAQTRTVHALNLLTGEGKAVLDPQADSEALRISRGGQLLLVSFRGHARGQACVAGSRGTFRCLERPKQLNGTVSDPFWVTESKVGFLERPVGLSDARIWFQDIRTSEVELQATGQIWSPWYEQGGRKLIWLERRGLVVSEGDRRQAISIPLPGLSGFVTLSDDGEDAYFSHFMNDTNQDQIVDGSDNGVIFRMRLRDRRLEQLTSSATNCSYPSVSRGPSAPPRLVLTCDFEGSLDLYEMPEDGLVPTSWSSSVLEDYLVSARSPDEQVLILAAIAARSPRPLSEQEMAKRYLSAFVQSQEWHAVKHHARLANDDEIERYAEARLEFAEVKTVFSPEERSRIDRAMKRDSRRGTLAWAWHSLLLGRDVTAVLIKRLNGSKANQPSPIVGHIILDLLHAQTRDSSKQSRFVWDAQQTWSMRPELPEQARLSYASAVLASQASRGDVQRSQYLRDPLLAPLAQAESLLRGIREAQGEALKMRELMALDRLLISKMSVLQLRSLAARSIEVLAEGQEMKSLNQVASQWLKLTPQDSAEFRYAREAFRDIVLDIAYRHQRQAQHQLAASLFYQSVLLTDDLESHFGYVRSMLASGQGGLLKERYENLLARNQVGESAKYALAMARVLEPNSQTGEAIRMLQELGSLKQDAVWALSLGSLRVRQFEEESEAAWAAQARRDLEVALELGYDRSRVQAAALQSLVVLEILDSQPGAAAAAFERLRALRPDAARSPELRYLAARAYQRTGQNRLAAELLQGEASVVPAPWLERRALNRLVIGEAVDAQADYERYLAMPPERRAQSPGPELSSASAALRSGRGVDEASQALGRLALTERGTRTRVLIESLRGHLARRLENHGQAGEAYRNAIGLSKQGSDQLSDALLFRARKMVQLISLETGTAADHAALFGLVREFDVAKDSAYLLLPEAFHSVWAWAVWPIWSPACKKGCKISVHDRNGALVLVEKILAAYSTVGLLPPDIESQRKRLLALKRAWTADSSTAAPDGDGLLLQIESKLRSL